VSPAVTGEAKLKSKILPVDIDSKSISVTDIHCDLTHNTVKVKQIILVPRCFRWNSRLGWLGCGDDA